jgi:hypothetical protein
MDPEFKIPERFEKLEAVGAQIRFDHNNLSIFSWYIPPRGGGRGQQRISRGSANDLIAKHKHDKWKEAREKSRLFRSGGAQFVYVNPKGGGVIIEGQHIQGSKEQAEKKYSDEKERTF